MFNIKYIIIFTNNLFKTNNRYILFHQKLIYFLCFMNICKKNFVVLIIICN